MAIDRRIGTALLICICAGGYVYAAPAAPVAVQDVPVGPVPGIGEPVGVTNPRAGDKNAIRAGRQWFRAFNCYGCHGDHGGGGMGPSLRDPQWVYGASDAQIFNSIAQGRGNGMPAWGSRLSEQTIWELTAYIRSLRTSSEADPPN